MRLDTRDEQCVTCGPPPACNCKSGQECSLTTQTCSQCPTIVCTNSSQGHSAGAIAGGVVGGVVALALVLGFYFLWRKRHARRAAYYDDNISPMMVEKDSDDPAYSIHSVNTAQARGSNVIPIAYIPGVSAISEHPQMRGSVATSDYRASLPDFVMAVHGQPSLVEISNLHQAPVSQAPSSAASRSSLYDGLGLDDLATAPFAVDTTEAGANSGKSMVTIPEEEEETGVAHRAVTAVPRMRTYDPRAVERQSERMSGPFGGPFAGPTFGTRPVERTSANERSSQQIPARHSSARYSRNSSVREYNMNIPEEAFLYYNNLDE